jgi:hypothetical protein
MCESWSSSKVSAWSAEARALLRPRETYRELASSGDEHGGSIVRKPAIMVFVLGCVVSALASGRFHFWLILDGALSFAFVPIIDVIAFAVVSRVGERRRMPFARAVDLYFVGFAPWLVWLTILAAIGGILSPRAVGPWFMPAVSAMVFPTMWAARLDFLFFRDVMQRSTRGAVRDLVLQRAMSWSGTFGYFFGIVSVSELPKLTRLFNL